MIGPFPKLKRGSVDGLSVVLNYQAFARGWFVLRFTVTQAMIHALHEWTTRWLVGSTQIVLRCEPQLPG
jgi:hypothetical protein